MVAGSSAAASANGQACRTTSIRSSVTSLDFGREALAGERVEDRLDRVGAGEAGGVGSAGGPPGVAGAEPGPDGSGEEGGEAPVGGGFGHGVGAAAR